MDKKTLASNIGKVTLTAVLATCMTVQVAAPALADTIEDLRNEEAAARAAAAAAEQEAQDAKNAQSALEAQVIEAQQQLEILGQEAEAAENDYITITNQLEETIARIEELDAQIEQTKAELEEAKADLANMVHDIYTTGRPTLLSVALNATSFDDLISRIQYANKVAQFETAIVNRVKELEARLEQERLELEELKSVQEQQQAEQAERLAAAEAAIAAVEEYQAQLSYEIQQKIAEADEAMRRAAAESARADAAEAQRIAEEEAQRRAAEEAARRQAEEEARRQAEEEARRQQEAAAAQAQQQQQSAQNTDSDSGSSSSSSEGSSSSSSGGSVSASYAGNVSAFVANAYSIIGSGYSWSGYYWTGDPSTSWFTCSGVVDFALGRAPRSSSPETLYAEVGSRMVYNVSQLNYGDLVFYACLGRAPGHVGIYIGNGRIIDSISSGGVAIRDVYYMTPMGGGPIL